MAYYSFTSITQSLGPGFRPAGGKLLDGSGNVLLINAIISLETICIERYYPSSHIADRFVSMAAGFCIYSGIAFRTIRFSREILGNGR